MTKDPFNISHAEQAELPPEQLRALDIPNTREIFRQGARYIRCQVLNWSEGPPPKYIVCNPLEGHGAGTPFVATQGMGTWMEVDAYEVARLLNAKAS